MFTPRAFYNTPPLLRCSEKTQPASSVAENDRPKKEKKENAYAVPLQEKSNAWHGK
jgi:hypothetical protein